jgi:hypothetical protein
VANKVIGGDYEGYIIKSFFGQISIAKGFKSIALTKDNVEKVEILTEEAKKKFLGTAGWGLAGGLLLGPLGLLAGAWAGGNKKEICFACYLKDGTKFMVTTDPNLYKKIAALVF